MEKHVGVAGLYLFAFTPFVGTVGPNVGLLLMLGAAVVASRRSWKTLLTEPVLILSVVMLAYLAIELARAKGLYPQFVRLQRDEAAGWWFLFLFWVPAFWLQGNLKRMTLVFGLAVAGLLLSIPVRQGWEGLSAVLTGSRIGGGISAIGYGLYYGVALLGLLIFAKQLIGIDTSRRMRYFLFAGLSLAAAACAYFLLVSYSRGSWIAFLVVAPFAVFSAWRDVLKRVSFKRATLAVCGLLAIAVLPFLANLERVKARFTEEAPALEVALEQGTRHAPSDSIGYRLRLWTLGTEKWSERPILGWGPGGARALIATGDDTGLRTFRHLHNGYLQVLVEFGIVGALLVAAALFLAVKALWNARRRVIVPHSVYVFLLGALGISLIWSLSNFQAVHVPWRYFWFLLAGAMYGYRFAPGEQYGGRQPASV